MIANNEKTTNRNNKELGYIDYNRIKSVTFESVTFIISVKEITKVLCLSVVLANSLCIRKKSLIV